MAMFINFYFLGNKPLYWIIYNVVQLRNLQLSHASKKKKKRPQLFWPTFKNATFFMSLCFTFPEETWIKMFLAVWNHLSLFVVDNQLYSYYKDSSV